MAGIYAVWRSLQRLGTEDSFDIHILSDSNDPDRWVQEEAAWNRLCTDLGVHGHIFYRRRRINLKRKSGNVADFCRRYGGSLHLHDRLRCRLGHDRRNSGAY